MIHPNLGPVSRNRAERFGVPVDSFNPQYWFIISLDYESRPPTVDELVLLRAYRDYVIRHVYNETYARKILAKPRPAEAGHNTVIFRKNAPNAWVYRRATWSQGPLYVPANPTTFRTEGIPLPALLDRVAAIGDHTVTSNYAKDYLDWRAARPEFSRFPLGTPTV